jgi:hypothetical protein
MQCVVVISGYEDYYGEIAESGRSSPSAENAAVALIDQAIRKAGITTNRKDPVQVSAKIYELQSKDGKPIRRLMGNYDITPPLRKMTSQEYSDELGRLLNQVPFEFRNALTGYVGDQANHEASIDLLDDLINILLEPITRYSTRLKNFSDHKQTRDIQPPENHM